MHKWSSFGCKPDPYRSCPCLDKRVTIVGPHAPISMNCHLSCVQCLWRQSRDADVFALWLRGRAGIMDDAYAVVCLYLVRCYWRAPTM